MVTILTVTIIVFIDFQKSLTNESAKVTMGEAVCVRKCSNESISVGSVIIKINTSSGLSTARINGLRHFYARHSQFRLLFIIYSFPLPGAKHAHLN